MGPGRCSAGGSPLCTEGTSTSRCTKERAIDCEVSAPVKATGEPTVRFKFPSPPALKKLGYWTLLIDVGDGKGNHLPLYQDIFSTLDPAYQALGEDAWSLTFLRGIDLVLPPVAEGTTWLPDRGPPPLRG